MIGPVNPAFYALFVKDGPFRVSERCTGCGHEVLAPRRKVEKSIKRVIPKEEPP